MTTAPKPATERRRTRRPALKLLLALVVVAAAAWLVRFGIRAYLYEETDDAQVAGHVHQVSAQVDGTLKSVLVADNQTVAAGDVLALLDPLEFELQLKRDEAGLTKARADEARARAAAAESDANLAGSKARLAAAQAQAAQAQVHLDLAGINRERARRLFSGGGAVTQADLDGAESAYSGAQAALAAARANEGVAEAAINEAGAATESARAGALSAQASVIACTAAVADAQRKLTYATVQAPSAGRIGNRNAEVGNRVQAGQVLFALVEPNPWLVANFKETQITRMHAGQKVDVEIDAMPDLELHGTVDSVAPASGAQFALLPPDNATGNFTKVVQRVPVKVILDAESASLAGERLRPGLSAVVSVRVR